MAISLYEGNDAITVRSSGPRAVGSCIAPIAGKTLAKSGPVMAGLLSQWPAITGPALAAYTMPAKLSKGAPEPDLPGSAASMLHLKVDPVKVLEVQYAIPQLVERINQTLGYKAIAGIRLVQAPVFMGKRPVPAAKPAIAKPQAQETPAAAPEAPLPEGKLGAALARMAAGIKARQANCQ